MTATLVEQAPAKINLTLRVIGKRADGYHELESLVAFADFADALSLTPADDLALEISGPHAEACGTQADNLVLKAQAALAARVPGLRAGRFHLVKNLPVAAGIGGGSSDAAAALRLIARANGIALDDPRLAEAARNVGADVPVCLVPQACIMRGVGEILSQPVGLPTLPAMLVNPGVAVATRDVFAKLAGLRSSAIPLGDVPAAPDALVAYLAAHGNDLTAPAIACAPVIAEVLDGLRALPGVRLARMSGSGATCFALFSSPGEAVAAAQRLAAAQSDWWVRAVTLG
ncbi:MAG TPA: 4-(cytidine 5'-diphospho)-2-C-methyl-D-erythritol kinase [Pseudolabrys sp.]|nr:4-(cytidine 5'-diphospho)-2-C-methyl-D-erythritol kinase [Pseudolabrys sp.]